MAYTISDKLAIALACLASVMAIILFLVEKTPATVMSLLLLMFALAIYPILHFAKRVAWRTAAFVGFGIWTVLFGIYVWPRSHLASASSHPQETPQQQAPPPQPTKEEPKPEQKKKPQKKTEAKPTVEQSSQGDNSPNINQQSSGSNSPNIAGSNNTVTYSEDRNLNGVLYPANDPYPVRPCPVPQEGQVALYAGGNGFLASGFPLVIVGIAPAYKNEFIPVLTIDRNADGSILLIVDIRSDDNKLIARIDKNRFQINRNNYFSVTKPDSSSLIVFDQYGDEALNVRFLNPQALRFTGKLHSSGRLIDLTAEGLTSGNFTITGICTAFDAAFKGNKRAIIAIP